MPQNKPPIRLFRDYKHLARLFYGGTEFVAFDTETTGLHAGSDSLLEIGAVRFNRNGIIGSNFDELIKPPVPIPEFISNLTNITDFMVQDCRSAQQVVSSFMEYAKDSVLIAHNAPFDVGFVNADLMHIADTYIKNLVVDTLPLSRWAYPDFIYEGQKGQYKLQSLAKRFNITVEHAHRADDDARVCMELFKKIISDTISKQKGVKATDANPLQLDLVFN